MLSKLESYTWLVFGSAARLGLIFDPRVASDGEEDDPVTLLFFVPSTFLQKSNTALPLQDTASRTNIFVMQDLLCKNDDLSNADDSQLPLREIATADAGIDLLTWCSVNSTHFSIMVELAQSVLFVQAT